MVVGTQMIAKGHDIHGVTLVGVVGADTALKFPDFRAAERTFQLLTQVAGRADAATHPAKSFCKPFSPITTRFNSPPSTTTSASPKKNSASATG